MNRPKPWRNGHFVRDDDTTLFENMTLEQHSTALVVSILLVACGYRAQYMPDYFSESDK